MRNLTNSMARGGARKPEIRKSNMRMTNICQFSMDWGNYVIGVQGWQGLRLDWGDPGQLREGLIGQQTGNAHRLAS